MESNRYLFIFVCTTIVGLSHTVKKIKRDSSLLLYPEESELIVRRGKTLNLSCEGLSPLSWKIPKQVAREKTQIKGTTFKRSNGEIQFKISLQVSNMSSYDVGFYGCSVDKNGKYSENIESQQFKSSNETKAVYVYVDDMKTLIVPFKSTINTKKNTSFIIPCKPTYSNNHMTLFQNNTQIMPDSNLNQAVKNFKHYDRRIGYTLIALEEYDNATYNCTAQRENYMEYKIFTMRIMYEPKASIRDPDFFILHDEKMNFTCDISGYPLPNLKWYFSPCAKINECEDHQAYEFQKENYTLYEKEDVITSNLTMRLAESGSVTCLVKNEMGISNKTVFVYATDVKNGFDITRINNPLPIGDNVTLVCTISNFYDFNKFHWYKLPENIKISNENNDGYELTSEDTYYSNKLILSIPYLNETHSGIYKCKEENIEDMSRIVTHTLEKQTTLLVKESKHPKIISSNLNDSEAFYSLGEQDVSYFCQASGYPKPIVRWYKNDDELILNENDTRIFINNNGSTLTFKFIKQEDIGKYSCVVFNRAGTIRKSIKLNLHLHKFSYLSKIIVIVIFIILMIIISILIYKIRRERGYRYDQYKTGFLNFEEGAIECLNPDLAVDEQAEHLPYDKKWDFPIDKLKLGKQLGSGAFGIVMKGIAQGIIKEDESTTVAIKMVKKSADPLLTRALVSELKIMVHLGSHLNIINLLGACTHNIKNCELFVIVEYCQFGNLHNFLLRNRSKFIDQRNPQIDEIDFNVGFENSIYTQKENDDTSETYQLNNSASIKYSPYSNDLTLNSNSRQPAWRSNLQGDYNYKKDVTIISSSDLVSWAFQIAAGLEYLANRKVLHGDLAARNILLSENNIVKICDFGLAKRMYKSYNYKKKNNSPLPVKWMAIESIRDRIFSIQSDVWAYGVVLWELFSLGCSPYPGMEADENLYKKLVGGYRMQKPKYATRLIYQIMLECWRSEPTQRPSFSDLVAKFGKLLDEKTFKNFIEIYSEYANMNKKWISERGNCDYLAQMCSPDYINFSYINPKHSYVNGPFGGSILVNSSSPEEDNFEYLCMNPTKFSEKKELHDEVNIIPNKVVCLDEHIEKSKDHDICLLNTENGNQNTVIFKSESEDKFSNINTNNFIDCKDFKLNKHQIGEKCRNNNVSGDESRVTSTTTENCDDSDKILYNKEINLNLNSTIIDSPNIIKETVNAGDDLDLSSSSKTNEIEIDRPENLFTLDMQYDNAQFRKNCFSNPIYVRNTDYQKYITDTHNTTPDIQNI